MMLMMCLQTPRVIERSSLKHTFLAANVGDHADDHRGKLTFNEFVVCVKDCMEQALHVLGEHNLPPELAQLKSVVHALLHIST